ncbi:SET domain-containing protein-lysine N-methyltransferase [Patescibacteria group bacterium]|nr:SET domain-containing protein-lysine N-methyltransferase [Patescibacteria group bacterium]
MLIIKSIEGKGRGVFTDTKITKGDIIETCPITLISQADVDLIKNTLIDSYTFRRSEGHDCLVFGFGMLYNHGNDPNAYIEEHYESENLIFIALRDIQANEEITYDYSGGEDAEIIFNGREYTYANTGNRQ